MLCMLWQSPRCVVPTTHRGLRGLKRIVVDRHKLNAREGIMIDRNEISHWPAP